MEPNVKHQTYIEDEYILCVCVTWCGFCEIHDCGGLSPCIMGNQRRNVKKEIRLQTEETD